MEDDQKKIKLSLKEEFAKFLEDPSRDKLREFLKNNLGEFENYDFKEKWPESEKIAKCILALSNSRGGCIFVGIKEKEDKTFELVGLDQIKDKSEIKAGISKFLPSKLVYEILDFYYPDSDYSKIKGMKFQVVIVNDLPHYIPFICSADGENIRKTDIYVRDKTDSVKASYEQLQEIINRRLETGHFTTSEIELGRHLQHLKALYDMIPQYTSALPSLIDILPSKRNPWYPSESFEMFILNMIKAKKERIKFFIEK
jgi:hypothetical protein